MITLRQVPFEDGLDLEWMMSYDTKKNILDHCRLASIQISSSYRKGLIGWVLADFFKKDPFYMVNKLSQEEQSMLSKLVARKSTDYITYPRNDDKFLLMQKFHLVVTYQTETEWYIFMPDCIRTILAKASEADIDYHPGMREYSDILADLTECNKRIQEFMDMGLMATISLPSINFELSSMEQRYKTGRKKHLALCQKYPWANKNKATVQDSISDALEFIGHLKKISVLFKSIKL